MSKFSFCGADLDVMAATAPGWDQDYAQVGHGRSRGLLVGVSSRRAQFGILRWQPGVLVRGEGPHAAMVFGIPLGDPGDAKLRGTALQEGVIEVVQPGQAIDLVANGPLGLGVFAVAQRDVRARAEALGHPLASHNVTRRLRVRSEADSQRMRQAALRLLRCTSPRSGTAAVAIDLLEADLLDAILQAGDQSAGDAPAVVRRRKARRALDYLTACVDRPQTTLGDVCRAVGTSERTLHLAFHEAFGTSPKALLKQLRLSAARRQLRSGACASVTDAALRCGYLHFGRFAADYRIQFGESPSRTLRDTGGASSSPAGERGQRVLAAIG
ncbi:MAG: AraC family transcriptional regulator [Deltaproteobacteria bacterium]|nr:AraC family transcriptional regulator [Deltaproteobacteria bacterium]